MLTTILGPFSRAHVAFYGALHGPRGFSFSDTGEDIRRAREALYQTANSITPWGVVSHEVETFGQIQTLTIYYAFTFALPFARCRAKAKSGCFPRPDTAMVQFARPNAYIRHARNYPPWFRSRPDCLIPFVRVPARGQDNADLTNGMSVNLVANTLDSSTADLSFFEGFGVRGPDGGAVVVRADCRLLLAD